MRFWRWNLVKICLRTCNMNSTLGSVVPLAMFINCIWVVSLTEDYNLRQSANSTMNSEKQIYLNKPIKPVNLPLKFHVWFFFYFSQLCSKRVPMYSFFQIYFFGCTIYNQQYKLYDGIVRLKYDNPDSQAAAISSPLSNKWLCPTYIYPQDYQFRSG